LNREQQFPFSPTDRFDGKHDILDSLTSRVLSFGCTKSYLFSLPYFCNHPRLHRRYLQAQFGLLARQQPWSYPTKPCGFLK
jgi:hypothetical protein